MPRLRVLTGPSTSLDALEDISHLVNTSAPYRIQSDAFDGAVIVHIKDFVGPSGGGSGGRDRTGLETGDAYFCSSERKGVTWSIQVRCVRYYFGFINVSWGKLTFRVCVLPW